MKKKKWSRIAAVGAVLFILAFGAACGDDKKNTEKNVQLGHDALNEQESESSSSDESEEKEK